MDSSKSEPMCCGVLDEYPEAAILLDQGIQAFILLFSLTMDLQNHLPHIFDYSTKNVGFL